ncbi:M57 family metalloprotease [uncultured Winogradskyella sp.]|uniref:M57 family metalloprotease n=1 Tax=uncultured Winogradskyella sp. TaxID=395353 RepID=UPI00262D53CA|nr:M57 family metalloprotease [uncultured Winogradskyella sp.]
MIKNFKYVLLTLCALTVLNSCQSEEKGVENDEKSVSPELLSKLADLDFDISEVKMALMFGEEGIRVEDMFFTEQQINELFISEQGQPKQYHTNNLVKKLPRVITIAVSPDLGILGSNALDDAIDMYNDVGSLITFQRVAFGLRGKKKAKIQVTAFSEQPSGGFITLGVAAGFPTRKGDPAKSFGINTVWFDLLSPSQAEVAGTMAHEIGHCIGFRHTDYQTRSSCGQNVNEGSAGVGAVYINGTPTGSDPSSLMQACGPAQTLNNNDITALLYMY